MVFTLCKGNLECKQLNIVNQFQMSGIFRKKYLWKTSLALHCLLGHTFFLQENPNNHGVHSYFQNDHVTGEEDTSKTKALWKQRGTALQGQCLSCTSASCATCWILKAQSLSVWSKVRLLQTFCRWIVYTIFSQAGLL